ncbi:MAG: hypothetical protein ACK59R_00140 [Pseudomonadota bacterium]|jgi:hypothetical protein
MPKSIREQAIDAAAKVGAVKQISVEGIDEVIHVARLSIEDRAGVSDTGQTPGRRANVAAAINLLFLAVVTGARGPDDKLQPYMSRDEWAAWAGDHPETFTRLSLAVQAAQGDTTADDAVALGNG